MQEEMYANAYVKAIQERFGGDGNAVYNRFMEVLNEYQQGALNVEEALRYVRNLNLKSSSLDYRSFLWSLRPNQRLHHVPSSGYSIECISNDGTNYCRKIDASKHKRHHSSITTGNSESGGLCNFLSH